MEYITWSIYEVWWKKRKYRIVIPEKISRLWAVYYRAVDKLGVTVDFLGNRDGLEALRQACTVLAEKNDMIVYIPCKKNNKIPMYAMNDFISAKIDTKNEDFVDLVFMKPNLLCIKDWKEIRNIIFRMQKRRWKGEVSSGNIDSSKKSTDRWKRKCGKAVYRFDTVFFNTFSCEYSYLASDIEEFLNTDLEKNFCEDIIRNDGRLRGETYLWYGCFQQCCSKKHYEFETGIFYWDNEIYEKNLNGRYHYAGNN